MDGRGVKGPFDLIDQFDVDYKQKVCVKAL